MHHAEDSSRIREAEARFRKGERAALGDIYEAAKAIARRMIARQMARRGFTLSEGQQEEKAHNAAAYIDVQYMKRPDFTLKKPASYVYLRVLHELYHSRKVDSIVDFRSQEELERWIQQDD